MFHLILLVSITFIGSTLAATADQWRGRSIYQVITDRYALPEGANTTACNVTAQTWCGGTWRTIQDNLDYIQDAGFTAIWISPVSQNYEGPRTVYGDPYHGYWIADASQLNTRFGTSDDLKALSAELHRRDMYLMVDIVANNVMATSITTNFSTYMFKDPSQYHPYCPIDWNNLTSIQNCWLGDTNVPLPDVNTQDPTVASAYGSWIQNLVQEYDIDGLRIDGAHVQASFWPSFCESAGVFCMGEVMDSNITLTSSYQQAMDSILNYPLYYAIVQGFTIPGPGNMSDVSTVMGQIQSSFKDPTILGNFLENQDIPRWHSISVDPQTLIIPINYYGQEQYVDGSGDPYNRGPLWTTGYQKTAAYNLTATLNKLRNYLVNNTDWAQSRTQVLHVTSQGLAIMKGNVVTIVTNIGSPPQNTSMYAYTPWPNSFSSNDILSCKQWAVGSNGSVEVEYSKGGTPVILVPDEILDASGLCRVSNGGRLRINVPIAVTLFLFLLLIM
ncbi:glycoside hydrolase family 13 protein [Russula vinacea]|nr:glycoside hydrolase family 13 protein [Russula vinacea]